ncbi:hypothetical protein [Pleionea sp. CnH1-48]|uniref:hypothetical protein n=1 Tax=Pleionea sp. CnH1-48 TaxID=2954494 RepID=UPI0020972633|nr:hypothetical protein [Pleionea sp. CnH1-48]MCO7223470.1 hypothetical protein [Pleionea sp. CnH1-48]
MKKIETLMQAIESGEKEQALQLVEELYNEVRDFSQMIHFDEKENSISIAKNSGSFEYAVECKERVKAWVGGH